VSASIRGTATAANGGNNALTLAVPAGTQDGDLVLALVMAASTTATTNAAAQGWWVLATGTVGTRTWEVLGRIYSAASPGTSLTLGAAAGASSLTLAIRDHAVSAAAHITMGSLWTRGANGGSQALVRAPSMTTPAADMLGLALFGEATNTVGGYTVTAANGFALAAELQETGSTRIEWLIAMSKLLASAGATGNTEVTWAHVGNNAAGQQLAIPSAAAAPLPATGRIGLHLATSVEHDRITVGFDRLAGSAVGVRIDGGTAVAATVEASSGWGSVTFTGLAPDSLHSIEFVVDGVLQTDVGLTARTFPAPGAPASFVAVTGSCQFTGSNHPVWDRIREDDPRVLAHMGDLHYADTSDLATWRAAVESSLTAPRMAQLLHDATAFTWTWDNHDRIMLNPGGAGTALNLGTTDPATAAGWKQLAGSEGWASADTAGRTFVIGRVRFIQTDHWTVRQDADQGLPAPLTMMGATQKAWWKSTLKAATEPVIVWLCQWTGQEHANGRWMSFPDETRELEAWLNARPEVKDRMVMVGGDSHSLQVTDGSRTEAQGQRFAGIPNWNISGFNRTATAGVGTPGWLVDLPLRTSAQPEADWGGYSRISVVDDGDVLELTWEGVRVGPDGSTDVMATQAFTVAPPSAIGIFDSVTGETLTPIWFDGTTEHPLGVEYHAGEGGA